MSSIELPSVTNLSASIETARFSAFRRLGIVARKYPLGAVCGVVVLAVVLVAVFANWITPYPPNENHPADALVAPNAQYWLGTDNFGRDVLSRIIAGSRISLQVGVYSMLVSMTVALVVGVTAGYFRGVWDYSVGRFTDVVQAFPGLLLLITLLSVFGRGVVSIGVIFGLVAGVSGSRIIRATTLSVAALPFVEAGRSIGCSSTRLVLRHVLPNCIPITIVLGSIAVGSAIIAEASLSFIGYGIEQPAPSWGGMLSSDGRRLMATAPWLFFAPTAALGVLVFALNMVGDAVRDALDPRLRGSR